MNNQDSYTDLFDRYLRNELSEAERAEFNENLLNNDGFNEAFIEHKTLALGIRDFGKAELKDYLKTHAAIPAGENKFRINRAIYAMAAMLVLFVGIYAIMNFYIKPNGSPGISLHKSGKKQEVMTDTNSIALHETEAEKKKTEAEAIAPAEVQDMVQPAPSADAPPAEISKDMATASGKASEDLGGTDDSKGTEREKVEYDQILSDYKTSDTILMAMNAVAKTESTAKNISNAKSKEYAVRKNIPSAANNNYSKNETVVNLDSAATFKKKSLESKPVKYTLEFWQSPVNFKGYKMNDKTIQLYGLSNKINLYSFNEKLYLRNGTNVYIMTLCPEGCTYKSETDQSIVSLILQQ